MSLVYNIFYNLAKLLARLCFRMRVIHPERMIESGPLILAANHASFFDPPLAGICSRRGVYYLARKTLLKWPFFGPLFPAMNVIPVERDGNDMSALREVIKKIKQGNGVVLFPEGTRSKDGCLQPARAGIGLVIAKTGAPVLPMRIFGSFDAFPKNSKRLHFPQITVVLGEPIHFSPEEITSTSRETYQNLSDRVMEAISSLKIE
ncbi:MAG: 1-acyl-sn-glycerol-3-phosphate acyltransferase [Verrucomicrobiaceae bacterium]|nr:MAG: 1-acyl-sn-glycerol-3-phosphate acyltransferase [Verrucomicrobiaceae bacterium]